MQSLARDGATLLGRVLDVDGSILKLGSDLRECIAFADDKSKAFKAAIDAFIDREGIQAKAPEPDPGEPACFRANRLSGFTQVLPCWGRNWDLVDFNLFTCGC